jgi:hypothetical protein
MSKVTITGFEEGVTFIETSDGTQFRRGVPVSGVSDETVEELKAQKLGLKVKVEEEDSEAKAESQPEPDPGDQDNPLGGEPGDGQARTAGEETI